MVGTIDVNIQAAHPEIPLAPVKAFLSSPSSFRIRNVPRRIGSWDITGVRPTVNYPDGTTVAADAALVGGVWVGTVPGCDTPGTSAKGFIVYADGIDENGYVVTDYVLGVGDVEVLNRENAVEPGTVTFKGDPGEAGQPGVDGDTPVIGENGNWWIGGEDTGKPARGPKGEVGGVQSVNDKTPDANGNVTVSAEDVLNGKQQSAVDSGITSDLVPKVLTIDETAPTKRIMLDGVTFTSFAALTALVQKGVTRLRYYVTNAASRPVLYTAHLCDASAIRFDATGTLGETMYTRSIAITKTGADGIAVSVGTLTPMAKASELDGKLDKVVEEGSTTVSFDTVNSSGVTIYDEEQGVWTYIVLGYINFNTYLDLKPGDDYRSLELYNSEDGGFIGRLAFTSDIAAATKLTPVWGEWVVEPTASYVRVKQDGQYVVRNGDNWEAHFDYAILNPQTGEFGEWTSLILTVPYNENATELNLEGPGVKATRAVDHYTTAKGESILAGTKTALFAGAVIKSSSTTLKNRDCAVVAYAAGMSLSFEAMNGLRSFEVIVTGCPANGDVGIPSTGYTYRGDASAMQTEEGDNHFTFAEYDTNKFFITRHVANEIGA